MNFDFIKQIWYRLKHAETIEDALKQLVSPTLVSNLSASTPSYTLVKAVADATSQEIEALLNEVASILELDVIAKPERPNSRLIEKSGYEESLLRKLNVIPQPDGISYKLVVSSLDAINRYEYEKLGIPICISTGDSIEAAWKAYETLQSESDMRVSEEVLQTVMMEMVTQSQKQGAKDILIGVPDFSHYEFISDKSKFRGSLHQSIYHTLKELLITQRVYSWNTNAKDITKITTSMDSGIILTTWQVHSDRQTSKPRLVKRDRPISLPKEAATNQASAKSVDSNADDTSSLEELLQFNTPSSDIMLIDDDKDFATIASTMMERESYTVTHCHDALSALKSLECGASLPKVIVSDMHMPNMDGSSFLRRLHECRIDIPVIMLTSDDDDLLEVELAELGAAAFIRKQQNPKILLAWLKNCLTRTKLEVPEELTSLKALKTTAPETPLKKSSKDENSPGNAKNGTTHA